MTGWLTQTRQSWCWPPACRRFRLLLSSGTATLAEVPDRDHYMHRQLVSRDVEAALHQSELSVALRELLGVGTRYDEVRDLHGFDDVSKDRVVYSIARN